MGPSLKDNLVLNANCAEAARLYQEAKDRYETLVSFGDRNGQIGRSDHILHSLSTWDRSADLRCESSQPQLDFRATFITIKVLGRGSFGEVDEVFDPSTGASYARKQMYIDPDKSSQTRTNEVVNEVRAMQKLRHLHIATLVFYVKHDDVFSIFMKPVAESDMGDYLQTCAQRTFLPEMTNPIYSWFGCLVDALAHAHRSKIKHQDIKPSNILIKNGQPYLCDFGLAKDFADTDRSASKSAVVVGTPNYRAPEVKASQERGRKADTFALGCVFSEMLSVCCHLTIEDYREMRIDAGSTIFRDCLQPARDWVVRLGKTSSSNSSHAMVADTILGMIEEDANVRWSLDQALNFMRNEQALFCAECSYRHAVS